MICSTFVIAIFVFVITAVTFDGKTPPGRPYAVCGDYQVKETCFDSFKGLWFNCIALYVSCGLVETLLVIPLERTLASSP